MRKITAVALLIICGLCVNGAYAAHVSVFGPASYVRDTATPVNTGDTFFAQSGDASLVVRNGNDDGSLRVTSAEISLNDEQIFSPDEFKHKKGVLETIVTLSEINSISVQLDGKPGSFLTVEIIQEVNEPTVTFQAAPVTIMMGDAAILTWESTDADYCTIEPDIGDVDPRGSISVSPAETTTYIITATGRGGIAAESVTMSVENPITPPHVEFHPIILKKWILLMKS